MLTLVSTWIAVLLPSEAVPSRPSDTPAEWVVERFDREEKLPPPNIRLVVENRFGDLRVRGSQTPSLRFHAVTQAAGRVATLPLEIERSDTTWTFRISGLTERNTASALARVDLAVELLEDRSLELLTQDGLLEVRGMRGSLRARSRKGTIDLRGTGPVELASEHGSIRWAVHPSLNEGTSRLHTVSGPIEVEVPTGTKATVTMETQGHFTTDFSLQVFPLGALRKAAKAVLAGGGPTIEVTSTVGEVRLLERPVARPTREGGPAGTVSGEDKPPEQVLSRQKPPSSGHCSRLHAVLRAGSLPLAPSKHIHTATRGDMLWVVP